MKLFRAYLRQTTVAICLCAALLTGLQAQTKSAKSKARNVRITLLQLNDVYQISPVDKGKNAGLARVATLRQRIKAESPNTLFLLAGDTISPSVASTIFKGAHIIETWNAAGLDYACLGNHEFDFGDDILIQRMKESKFTWLAANIFDRRTNRNFNAMPPFVIREFDGVKVGLLGLLTTDTETSSKPSKNLRFADPIFTTRVLVRQMRAKGARVIVAITHLTMSKDKELAATGLVDVIIGGHEHEILQSLAGRTPIFKWGADARVLGRIDLNVNAATGKLESLDWAGIPVTDATPEDKTVGAVVEKYESRVSAELDKPTGRTSVELDGRSIANRTGETNLSNFVVDAYRQAMNADIGFGNGGGIRANKIFPAGQL
ncbi:MAG: bifunctional metallophosphatase/5'-nucleotidase, partial [Blastocatellia bacterium]